MAADVIKRAAEAIATADALLIGAGAGMGVDSGLPDFRGDEGFWKAYPPFEKLGLSFYDLANPAWFFRDPKRAWGFYGHRLNLYRATEPHQGYSILRSIGDRCRHGGFVFTSNVDGQFHSAGFESARTVECHGAIDFLQCVDGCCDAIWPADNVQIDVDEQTLLARPPLPRCGECGGLARPNILMFGDFSWLPQRTSGQISRYQRWCNELPSDTKFVAIELGAGTAIATVRCELERRTAEHRGLLVRVNPRESDVTGGLAIRDGAERALLKIAELLST